MTWFEVYNRIFQQIKVILESIEEIEDVNLGGAFRITSLPLVTVIPRETRISQVAVSKTLRCDLIFDIIVFIRETEPEDWFSEIILPMGRVFDAFISNRTLNNTVLDLIPSIFSPGEITALNRLYYGGLIRFQAVFHFTY
ncbi:MAG: hypothetical protein QXV23_02140 [Candidatus Bathyarchaeia archaeon]